MPTHFVPVRDSQGGEGWPLGGGVAQHGEQGRPEDVALSGAQPVPDAGLAAQLRKKGQDGGHQFRR